MKKVTYLLLIFVVVILIGCSNDEPELTGIADIYVSDAQNTGELKVCAIENENYPLYSSGLGTRHKLTLNVGNYLVKVNGQGMGFQICGGETVTLVYSGGRWQQMK